VNRYHVPLLPLLPHPSRLMTGPPAISPTDSLLVVCASQQ
jgi:hypothetical protein